MGGEFCLSCASAREEEITVTTGVHGGLGEGISGVKAWWSARSRVIHWPQAHGGCWWRRVHTGGGQGSLLSLVIG